MASNTVIVFGPTGNVASVAAVTAQEKGAKVILAMRDPAKKISGLSAEQERAGGYERVQADLLQPDSVSAAVNKTGAQAAFIYLAHGSSDHMKATIQALKDAGIKFVVFLSSYTVKGPLEEVPPSDMISFMHAQIELNLEAIFGSKNYVAVRPGGFATNVITWSKKGITDGAVKLYCPDAKFDYITPDDMGRVSGIILASGTQQHGGEKHVPLFGPHMTSQREAMATLSEVLDKKMEVIEINEQESVDNFMASHMPRPLAEYLSSRLADVGDGIAASDPPLYEGGVANIEKYTGRSPMGFKEWARNNKELFVA